MDLQLLGKGRHRTVYALPDGRWVLKVPNDPDWGLASNDREARNYQQDTTGKLAACYMLSNGNLVMERVTAPYMPLPEWCDYVDCGQVGLNASGALVAYDYGY